jgi:hypothetical protein
VDSAGNLYVADTYNYTIRKITPAGVVSRWPARLVYRGSADGTGSAALFSFPNGVTVSGGLHVMSLTLGITQFVKLLPGVGHNLCRQAGAAGNVNGTGSAAQFNYPYGLSATSTGTIYVADSYNREIRKITSARAVTTLAGSATTDGGGVGSTNGTGRAARFLSKRRGGNWHYCLRGRHEQ